MHISGQIDWKPRESRNYIRVQRVQSMQIINENDKEIVLGRIIFRFKPLDEGLKPVVDVERIKRSVRRNAQIVRVKQTVQLLANNS